MLISNFLGFREKDLIPKIHLEQIYKLSEFIVESEKSGRAYLKHIQHPIDQDAFRFHLMDKRMRADDLAGFFQNCLNGADIGLLSDAGTPCLADPGCVCVDFAHNNNIQVRPLDGLNSLLLALMASGFNGQQFRFHGYLPFDKHERGNVFQIMREGISRNESQIFIETPYRNTRLLEELVTKFPAHQYLLVASNITFPDERFDRRTIHDWKRETNYLHKIPAVFVLGTPCAFKTGR